MSCNYYIGVLNPDTDKSKWIENTDEAKRDAVKDGFIRQSTYEFLYKPEPGRYFPPCTGDLFLTAFVPYDPPVGILALRTLLAGVQSQHPSLDLSMLGFYMENTGRVLVRIPAPLFGGESASFLQRNYHRELINRFLAYYPNSDLPIELLDYKRSYLKGSERLTLEGVIWPCTFPDASSVFWLPSENSTDRHFTVELDDISFMEDPVDDIWQDVKDRKTFAVKRTPVQGKPLERAYQDAQYRITAYIPPSVNRKSLSQCEVYENTTKDPKSFSSLQIYKFLELLAPLGYSGQKEAARLFGHNRHFTREKIEERFLDADFGRHLVSCSELKEHFECRGDCGVQTPYQLEEKAAFDNATLTKYRMEEDGLYCSPSLFKQRDDAFRLCSKFNIIARVRDTDSNSWSKLVEVYDHDNNIHQIVIPNEEFTAVGDALINKLVRNGLEITSFSSKKPIKEYCLACNPEKCVIFTSRTGWSGDCYVLPDTVIGHYAIKPVYSGDAGNLQTSGTLSEWRSRVGFYCTDNKVLMFIVQFALTGPLLEPCHVEGFGVHFYGPSSSGKTTGSFVGGSVWGGEKGKGNLNQWNTTSNAIENTAVRHNDGFLVLDEISEADPETVYKSSYMLINGQGKERSRADGTARKAHQWRLNYLSTGEKAVSDKIEENRRFKAMAGQEVRVINLPIGGKSGNNAFTELHGFETPAALSDYLKSASTEVYGSLSRAFLEKLCGKTPDEQHEHKESIKQEVDNFVKRVCPREAAGQIHRVARKFGLVAAAGVFAARYGLINWSEREAREVAEEWFQVWLERRGSLGNLEVEKAIQAIQDYWARFRESRFCNLDKCSDPSGFPRELSGYYWKSDDEIVFFLKSPIFTDLIRPAATADVLDALEEQEILLMTREGTPVVTKSINGVNVRGFGFRTGAWLGKGEKEKVTNELHSEFRAETDVLKD